MPDVTNARARVPKIIETGFLFQEEGFGGRPASQRLSPTLPTNGTTDTGSPRARRTFDLDRK